MFYEETLKQSTVDKKLDDKDALELQKIYNLYPDKRPDIVKITQFKVEDVFGDIIGKDSISPEQITEINKFLPKKMLLLIFV